VLKNPVMLFMVLAIVFSGAGAICTSLAALFHHPPTADQAPAATSAVATTAPPKAP
jgi:hypothetical protein